MWYYIIIVQILDQVNTRVVWQQYQDREKKKAEEQAEKERGELKNFLLFCVAVEFSEMLLKGFSKVDSHVMNKIKFKYGDFFKHLHCLV